MNPCKLCSFNGLAIISAILVIFYAYSINDVVHLAPMWSDQWWAEMRWWTLFMLPIEAPAPIPLSMLKHKHSDIEVLEFWVHNDSKAVEKFLQYAGNPEHDDKVVILRGVWANNTETKLRNWNTVEGMRMDADLSKEYEVLVSPPHHYRHYESHNLSYFFDNVERHDTLHGLYFDFNFLTTQPEMFDEYKQVWSELDDKLLHHIMDHVVTTHTFIYHGPTWRSPLHAAISDDYFLQVSGRKKWGFINKKYTPYVNARKVSRLGVAFIMETPYYMATDFPEDSVPFTEVTVGPGDLMWFPTWHWHDVTNLDNELGVAFGMRTFTTIKDQFGPYNSYNLQGIAKLAVMRKLVFKIDYLYAKIRKWQREPCKNNYGHPLGFLWNGTKMVRYDFKMVDGECVEKQREEGFTIKELTNEYHWLDWRPASM